MTIQVRWVDETSTVVLFEVLGQWTWDDLNTSMQEMYTMQATVGHAIHCIIDMQAYNKIPLNALVFGRRKMNQPMLNGMVVFVGASSSLKTVFDIFSRVYQGVPEKIRFCDTLEQALSMTSAHAPVQLPILERAADNPASRSA